MVADESAGPSPVTVGQRQESVDPRADEIEIPQRPIDLCLAERARRDDEVETRALARQKAHLRHVVDLPRVRLGVYGHLARLLGYLHGAARLLDLDDGRTPLRDEVLVGF